MCVCTVVCFTVVPGSGVRTVLYIRSEKEDWGQIVAAWLRMGPGPNGDRQSCQCYRYT